MILILTCSFDTTTDLLIPYWNGLPVFRFNIDLWRDYSWSIGPSGFNLVDPLQRVCQEHEVGAVYLRKLLFNPPRIDVLATGSEEGWCREEVTEVWEGIRDWAHHTNRLALVHPAPTGRWNKIRQMRAGVDYFRVPQWLVCHGTSPPDLPSPTVVKTFGTAPPGCGGIVTVQQVEPGLLDRRYPWFLQKLVEGATHDVTVAHVVGRNFAFETPRDGQSDIDCRLATFENRALWTRCELSPEEEAAVNAFMHCTGYSFGRLDFLRDRDGLWFLEVNPNGQFGWLDPDGKEGLLQAVADEVLTVHQRTFPV